MIPSSAQKCTRLCSMRCMTTRRATLIVLGAAALAAPLAVLAQRLAKVPVIGYMSPVVPENNSDWRYEAFRQGMSRLGYVEGKNVRYEVRWGEGALERMPGLAAELVRL